MKQNKHLLSVLRQASAAGALALTCALLTACGGGGGSGGSGSSGGTVPVLSGTITGPSRVVTNQLYNYNATAANGAVASYSWDWGDSSGGAINASTSSQSKVWRAAGNYTASLTLTASNGVAQATQTVAVVDHPVSSGNEHSCAILQDNTVACWGNNQYGQLGDGKTANNNLPSIIAGLADVVSLAAHGYSTCAAKSDGSVWCWGFQGFGGANFANPTQSLSPQQVNGLTDVVALTGGDDTTGGGSHVCALQRSGTVQCWGINDQGELGRGGALNLINKTASLLVPQPVVGLMDAVSIAASGHSTCAIRSGGTVVCWGYGGPHLVKLGVNNPNNTVFALSSPIAVTGVSNAVSLAMSHTGNACAVLSDGAITCWGENTAINGVPLAQTSTTLLGPLPKQLAGISNVAALTLGYQHACALKTDATVDCWGTYGVRANFNTAVPQPTPLSVKDANGAPLTNVQSVSSGIDHTCASKFDGTVHCWGWNSSGQLGDGANLDHTAAKPVVFTGVAAVTVKVTGNAISAGAIHTCAIKSNGDVACWGFNSTGQLGNGTNIDSNLPVPVVIAGSVTAVSAGTSHTCALKTNGDVTCWGQNLYGQLGNGSNVDSNTPVAVSIPGGAVAIASGTLHSCAVKTNGDVVCWGQGTFGQLGNGSPVNVNVPTTVNISGGVVSVSAGYFHTCALKLTSEVVCWGSNRSGQLGNAGSATPFTPVSASLLRNVVATSSTGETSCALNLNGEVACWGYGDYGQLGNASNSSSNIPVRVTDLGSAIAVSTGYFHTCALNNSGQVSCWGLNSFGQLGNGSNSSTNSPMNTNLIGPANAITSGNGHSCALQVNGDVYCWGYGLYGGLGNGANANSNVPVKVIGLTSLVSSPLLFWK